MLPGKIEPAQPISTILQNIRKDVNAHEIVTEIQLVERGQDSQGNPTYDLTPVKVVASSSNEIRLVDIPLHQNKTDECLTTLNTDAITVKLDEKPLHEKKQPNETGQESTQQPYQHIYDYIPQYSPLIKTLLESGEIIKEWDKMIEETAYHVLSVGGFNSRGIYADFGRVMCTKYPCISHPTTKEPWGFFTQKLSQKVRHIRWRWNLRNKGGHRSANKKRKVSSTPSLTSANQANENMNMEEAEKVISDEFKKPIKERDIAAIDSVQRGTLVSRRAYIEKKGFSVAELIEKFPFLGDSSFIEKEFFLMKEDLKKEDITSRWKAIMAKVIKMFDDNSEMVQSPDVSIEHIRKLEDKLKFYTEGGKSHSLLTIYKACEWREGHETKKDEPPQLAVIHDGKNAIQSIYIIGCGLQINTETTSLQDGLLKLMYTYYAWDISYPKQYQLLGFIQHYILQDNAKFFTSPSYLKFTKMFDSFE